MVTNIWICHFDHVTHVKETYSFQKRMQSTDADCFVYVLFRSVGWILMKSQREISFCYCLSRISSVLKTSICNLILR